MFRSRAMSGVVVAAVLFPCVWWFVKSAEVILISREGNDFPVVATDWAVRTPELPLPLPRSARSLRVWHVSGDGSMDSLMVYLRFERSDYAEVLESLRRLAREHGWELHKRAGLFGGGVDARGFHHGGEVEYKVRPYYCELQAAWSRAQ